MSGPSGFAVGLGGAFTGLDQGLTLDEQIENQRLERQNVLDQIQARKDYQSELEQDRQDRLKQQAQDAADRKTAAAQAAKDRESAATEKQRQAQLNIINMIHDPTVRANMMRKHGLDEGIDVPVSAFEEPEPILPSWAKDYPPAVQRVIAAKLAGVNVTPSEMESPDEKAAADAARLKQQNDANAAREIGVFKQEKAIDQQQAAAKAQQDDPTLPFGVKSWIVSLNAKHNGDYTAADQDFISGLSKQLAVHPHLSTEKARQMFDSTFASPTRALNGIIIKNSAQQPPDQPQASPSGGGLFSRWFGHTATPTSGQGSQTPPSQGPQSAASASTPVSASAPTDPASLVATARSLMAQYQAEPDPNKRSAIAAQLRTVQGQLRQQQPPTVGGSSSGQVSDDALNAEATTVLSSRGAPATLDNVARFVQQNRQALTVRAQMSTVLQQLQTEPDPAKQAALRATLATLRQQYTQAAAAGGGGQ